MNDAVKVVCPMHGLNSPKPDGSMGPCLLCGEVYDSEKLLLGSGIMEAWLASGEDEKVAREWLRKRLAAMTPDEMTVMATYAEMLVPAGVESALFGPATEATDAQA